MRTFWIIVGLFAVATLTAAWWRGREDAAPPAPVSGPVSAPVSGPVSGPVSVPVTASVSVPAPASLTASEPKSDTDESLDALAADLFASEAARRAELGAPMPIEAVDDDDATPDDTVAVTVAEAPTVPDADTAAATNSPRPAIDVDLPGAGTRDDPYRLDWDTLLRTASTYRPRDGKTEIPPTVLAIDGAWVRLTGYLAFPLASSEVDEALLMLNQWDGCCVGVPPSPYDGIEVKLTHPISIRRTHRATFGTVDGRFKVDPYLVNNWLVGMWIIDDGSIEMGF